MQLDLAQTLIRTSGAPIFLKHLRLPMSFGASTRARLDEDRVMEGLRVPSHLETVQTVNFVLTQEPGKLKPKDLKAAIERNRAEKEQRAEEQRRLREEGGGAGMLDLRGILAEERLNAVEGDPFKRQLRELAFLADVEDVEKLEIEKGFRISEDYVGSGMLSNEDIQTVYKQRKVALLHKKRAEWRAVQGRRHTGLYPPMHQHVKAGTSAETAKRILSLTAVNPSATLASTAEAPPHTALMPPHFDPNRNDIWVKRMNTLRRFISVVSKWLIRRRVQQRMHRVMTMFHDNQCHTREEIRAFIENATGKKLNKKTGAVGATVSSGDAHSASEETKATEAASSSTDRTRPASVSAMIFSEPNPVLTNRERNAAILTAAAEAVQRGEAEITADMARRILFPQCNPTHGGGGNREVLPTKPTAAQVVFDDRTFFQLKVKPEYLSIGYQPEAIPAAPVYFPTWANKDLRQGAPEECALRPPADAKVDASDIQKWIPEAQAATEPAILTKLRESGVPPPPVASATPIAPTAPGATSPSPAKVTSSATASVAASTTSLLPEPVDNTAAIIAAMPAWLTSGEDQWATSEVDYLHPTPGLRVFGQAPRRSELDGDWALRPDSEVLVYERDQSLRSTWCAKPGFLSANIYLLGNQEARNRDPPPPSGPTLAGDYYLPDQDRHRSGLSCYAQDHLRGVTERDRDIPPLQRALDRNDYLTDSESDNEDGYGDFKPTMERVRKILVPPPPPKVEVAAPAGKGGKDAKKGAPASAPAPTVAAPPPQLTASLQSEGGFSTLLEDSQRREEQVELLRDRKTLDLESTILKERRTKQDEFTKRLCEISGKSRCLVQALPVQMPFHTYEDSVYALVEPRMPALNPLHVEVNLSRSNESLPQLDISGLALSPTRSPTKPHY